MNERKLIAIYFLALAAIVTTTVYFEVKFHYDLLGERIDKLEQKLDAAVFASRYNCSATLEGDQDND